MCGGRLGRLGMLEAIYSPVKAAKQIFKAEAR